VTSLMMLMVLYACMGYLWTNQMTECFKMVTAHTNTHLTSGYTTSLMMSLTINQLTAYRIL
jgi:hypothetical protein